MNGLWALQPRAGPRREELMVRAHRERRRLLRA